MKPRERVIESLWGTLFDALFMIAALAVATALIASGLPLGWVIAVLLVVVAVCNWIGLAPDNDNDNFPGGPPAAA